ncbi:MAG: VWA domain-containing protein, partial [bacterium]|nr:VWA domain-containing protein [bacterium]
MVFANPWILVVFIPFILLFFFLKKIEKRRYLDIPTSLIVKRIGPLKSFFKKSGRAIWILAVLLLVIALGRPQSISETQTLSVEGRMMVLSVDLSTSMSSNSYSKTGRASVDVIKELSLEFVKKRATTDLVGITAYGGKSFGRQNGEAAVIVFPNSEYSQLEASIKSLKPYMLGSYTSIGEGIFLSILSLIDQDTLKDINISALVESIESQDKTYALELVKKLGRYRNRIIILFTDGKNNAGIEPMYPLWFCKMLGIKVYFAALESTGVTGLSEKEEVRQKECLIQGVFDTGGKYFEMGFVEKVKEFYDEIDRLETARLEITAGLEKKADLYFWPVLIGLMLVFVG